MPLQHLAVDAEGLSRWRDELELATQDLAALYLAGEDDAYAVCRWVSPTVRSDLCTNAARERANAVCREKQGPDETRSARKPRRGRGRLYVVH